MRFGTFVQDVMDERNHTKAQTTTKKLTIQEHLVMERGCPPHHFHQPCQLV